MNFFIMYVERRLNVYFTADTITMYNIPPPPCSIKLTKYISAVLLTVLGVILSNIILGDSRKKFSHQSD